MLVRTRVDASTQFPSSERELHNKFIPCPEYMQAILHQLCPNKEDASKLETTTIEIHFLRDKVCKDLLLEVVISNKWT